MSTSDSDPKNSVHNKRIQEIALMIKSDGVPVTSDVLDTRLLQKYQMHAKLNFCMSDDSEIDALISESLLYHKLVSQDNNNNHNLNETNPFSGSQKFGIGFS